MSNKKNHKVAIVMGSQSDYSTMKYCVKVLKILKINHESKIVSAMKAGTRLVVLGTSSRGTDTEDIYSLFGFTAALKLIDKACGR